MFKRLCCLLLLLMALLACRLSADNENESATQSAKDEANAELCKKYDSCGCVSYKACLESSRKDTNLDKPGVRACMLASSCESLCDAKPDGCIGGRAASEGGGAAAPQRSDCSSVSCSKNSDCPSDCYGGCDGVRCYSF